MEKPKKNYENLTHAHNIGKKSLNDDDDNQRRRRTKKNQKQQHLKT